MSSGWQVFVIADIVLVRLDQLSQPPLQHLTLHDVAEIDREVWTAWE
jgi:hypothetical protein